MPFAKYLARLLILARLPQLNGDYERTGVFYLSTDTQEGAKHTGIKKGFPLKPNLLLTLNLIL